MEFNNDINDLDINNIFLLDRLLINKNVREDLKKIIINLKNRKSQKRNKVFGERWWKIKEIW